MGRIAAKLDMRAVQSEMLGKLAAANLALLLVTQAQTRIMQSGDSEIRYAVLWATEMSVGYRAYGIPLRDTGILFNGLTGRTEVHGDTLVLILIDGSGYGVKHQEGFFRPGPVAVPLTRAAARVIPDESPHDVEALRAIGLKEGLDGDFVIFEDGVDVPARPIHRMAPENIEELREAIADALAA